MVCKLWKSIYRLKQVARSYNITFRQIVQIYDFIQNPEELCVYKCLRRKLVIFLILYIEDVLLVSNDVSEISFMKLWLENHLMMKDLGEAKYILAIKLLKNRERRMIGLS